MFKGIIKTKKFRFAFTLITGLIIGTLFSINTLAERVPEIIDLTQNNQELLSNKESVNYEIENLQEDKQYVLNMLEQEQEYIDKSANIVNAHKTNMEQISVELANVTTKKENTQSSLDNVNNEIEGIQAEINRIEAERRAEQERIEIERHRQVEAQRQQQAQQAPAQPAPSGRIVYWTVRGDRIHPSRNCPGLRNANPRNIRSGTVAEAGSRTKCQRASW